MKALLKKEGKVKAKMLSRKSNRHQLQDLRRRKQAEQRRIFKNKWTRRKEEGWEQVLSKKDALLEKRFHKLLERLKNTTSFYISNLPEGCSDEKLWRAFEYLNNLEDNFIPSKRDRAGNCFGFIKLSGVEEPEKWLERMQGISIDAAILGVNTALLDREGRKADINPQVGCKSVFTRIETPSDNGVTRVGEKVSGNSEACGSGDLFVARSFREAVDNQHGGDVNRFRIDIPPVVSEARRIWESKTLIGEVKDFKMLNELPMFYDESGLLNVELKYVGVDEGGASL